MVFTKHYYRAQSKIIVESSVEEKPYDPILFIFAFIGLSRLCTFVCDLYLYQEEKAKCKWSYS